MLKLKVKAALSS